MSQIEIPKILNIEGTINRQIRVSLSPSGSSGVIGYKFYIDNKLSNLNIRPVKETNIYTLDHDGFGNELEYGVPYTINVVAYRQTDESSFSDNINAITIFSRPSQPIVNSIKGFNESIHISWTPNSYNIIAPTEGYHIYLDGVQSNYIGRDTSFAQINNLINGQVYNIKLVAYGAGKAESITDISYNVFPIGLPNKPLNVVTTSTPDNTFRFVWDILNSTEIYPVKETIIEIITNGSIFKTYRVPYNENQLHTFKIPISITPAMTYNIYTSNDSGISENTQGSFPTWVSDSNAIDINYSASYNILTARWTNLSNTVWQYPITEYKIRIIRDGVPFADISKSIQTTEYQIPIKYGSETYFTICAANVYGDERPISHFTYLHIIQAINVSAVPISDSSIQLSWERQSSLWGESIAGYRIYSFKGFKDSARCLLYEISGSKLYDISSTLTTFIIQTDQPHYDKYFFVPYTSSYKSMCATLIDAGLNIVVNGFTCINSVEAIKLQWTPLTVTNFPVYGYEIYNSITNKSIVYLPSSISEYTDFKLIAGLQYKYKIRAVGVIPGPFTPDLTGTPYSNTPIQNTLIPLWKYNQNDFKIIKTPYGYKIIPKFVMSTYNNVNTNNEQTCELLFRLVETDINNNQSFDPNTSNSELKRIVNRIDDGIKITINNLNGITSPANRLFYKGEGQPLNFMLYPIDYNNNEALEKPVFTLPARYSETALATPSINIQRKSVTINWQIRQNVWDEACTQYIIKVLKHEGTENQEFTFREYGCDISSTTIHLDAGKYTVSITAQNVFGYILPLSTPTTEFIIMEEPAPVRQLDVISKYAVIDLIWQKPVENEYNACTGYKIIENGSEILVVDSNTLNVTLTGREINKQYLYSVVPYNQYGNSKTVIEKIGRAYSKPRRPDNVIVHSGNGRIYINVQWTPLCENYVLDGFNLYKITEQNVINPPTLFYKSIGLGIEEIEQQNGATTSWRVYSVLNGVQSDEYLDFNAVSYFPPNRVSNLSASHELNTLSIKWSTPEITKLAPLKGYTIYLDGRAAYTIINNTTTSITLNEFASFVEIVSIGADNMRSTGVQIPVEYGTEITNLRAPYREANQIYIEWDKHPEAVGYYIYKDNVLDGYSINEKYAVMNLTNNRKYTIIVKGVRQDGTLIRRSFWLEITPENIPISTKSVNGNDPINKIDTIEVLETSSFEQTEIQRKVRIIFDPIPSAAFNYRYNPFQVYVLTTNNGVDPINMRNILSTNATFTAPADYYRINSYFTLESFSNKVSSQPYTPNLIFFPLVDGTVNTAISVSYDIIDYNSCIIRWSPQMYLGQTQNNSLRLPVVGYNIYIMRSLTIGSAIESKFTIYGVYNTEFILSQLIGEFYCVVVPFNGYGDETQRHVAIQGSTRIQLGVSDGEIGPYFRVKQKDMRLEFFWEAKNYVYLEPTTEYILYKLDSIDAKTGIKFASFDAGKTGYDISMIDEESIWGLAAISESGKSSPISIFSFKGKFPSLKPVIKDTTIQLTVTGSVATGIIEFTNTDGTAKKYQILDETNKILDEALMTSSVMSTLITIKGVKSNETYIRRIRLLNDGGYSPISDDIYCIVPLLPKIPDLSTEKILNGIKLKWIDIGTSAIKYIIYYSADGIPERQIEVNGLLRECIITNLDTSLIYNFQIAMRTHIGLSSKSKVISSKAGRLPVDAADLITKGKNNILTVSWTQLPQPDNTSAVEYLLTQIEAGNISNRTEYVIPYGATSYEVTAKVGVWYNFELKVRGIFGSSQGINNSGKTQGISLNRVRTTGEGKFTIDLTIGDDISIIDKFQVYLNNKEFYATRSTDVSYPDVQFIVDNLQIGIIYKVQTRILYKSGAYSPISNSITIMAIGRPKEIEYIGGGFLLGDTHITALRSVQSQQSVLSISGPSIRINNLINYTATRNVYNSIIYNVPYFLDYKINSTFNGRPVTAAECTIEFVGNTISGCIFTNSFNEVLENNYKLNKEVPRLDISFGSNRIVGEAVAVAVSTVGSQWQPAAEGAAAATPTAFFVSKLSNSLGSFEQRFPFTIYRQQTPYTQLITSSVSNGIKLTWNNSQTIYNYPIIEHEIYRNSTLIATISGISQYIDTSAEPYSRYIYSICAKTLIGRSIRMASQLVLFKAFAPLYDIVTTKIYNNIPHLTVRSIIENPLNNDTQISATNYIIGHRIYINDKFYDISEINPTYPIEIPLDYVKGGDTIKVKVTTNTYYNIESEWQEKTLIIPYGVVGPNINIIGSTIYIQSTTGNINGIKVVENGTNVTKYNITIGDNVIINSKSGVSYSIYGFYESGAKYIESAEYKLNM